MNGLTQFLGCAALALGFFSLIGVSGMAGNYGLVYLAVATSLSSTLVVVKILSDRMELDSMTSRITLGILVLQDLWAIAFLAVQPDLANLALVTVAKSMAKAGCLVVVSSLCARFVLPTIFARAGKQPELMLIVAMAWCFAICGLADQLHLSLEMGALVAGVTIASFPYHFDVAGKVSSLRDFFVTLFFVSLGLQIPMPTLEIVGLALAIMAFVIVSRLLTIFPVLHALNYGNRASLVPALNLGQLSEFALVLGALGVSYGHITPELLSAFVLAMVGSALISSLVIPYGHSIHLAVTPFLEKIGFKDRVGNRPTDAKAKGQTEIVLLGFHRNASSLLHTLLERHPQMRDRVLVADFNPEVHKKLTDMGIPCKYGDIGHIDILRQLDLAKADLVICTIPDSLLKGVTNLQLLRNLRLLAPEAGIIVTAETVESANQMYADGADFVFMPRLVGAAYLADAIDYFRSAGSGSTRAKAIEGLKDRIEVLP